MDALYECDFEITRKMYLAWGRESNTKKERLALRIMWCAIAALALLFCVLYASPFFVLIFILAVYRAFFRQAVLAFRQYAVLAKINGGENWTRKYLFGEEAVTMQEGNGTVKYSYTDIKKMEEQNNYIKIFLSNNLVLRLYADKFVTGSWEECRQYINRK